MALVRCTCLRAEDVHDVVLPDPLCPAEAVHLRRAR